MQQIACLCSLKSTGIYSWSLWGWLDPGVVGEEPLSALTRRGGRHPVFSLTSAPSAKQEASPTSRCTQATWSWTAQLPEQWEIDGCCSSSSLCPMCSRAAQDETHQHLRWQTQRTLGSDPDQLFQGFVPSPTAHAEVVCGSEKWI